MPEPRPWGVSDEEAVQLCREWMIHLGATDTLATEASARNVCDLYSARFLAWVENLRRNLDVDRVERAAAVSNGDGRYPLLFTSGGVFPEARDRADMLGVALLRFRAQDGALDGANTLGRHVRIVGLAET